MNFAERLLFLVGFVAMVLSVFAIRRFWKRTKQRARESWFVCDGHVEKTAVTEISTTRFWCEISYSYQASGLALGGCFGFLCRDEQRGWDIMRPFQDGTIHVQYDPRDSAKSAVVEFDNLEVFGGRYIR